MNKYELVYKVIQESLDNGKITLEEAEVLNDYAYDKYIMEAEEDHKLHMAYKNRAAKELGKDSDSLVNKKYKKDSKKADLYYKAKDGQIKRDDEYNDGNSFSRRLSIDRKLSDFDDNGYDQYYHDIELGDKDIATKALTYMKKHSNLKNEKEYKKYKVAFNIFCRRFNIPENSSLWIKFNPGNKIKNKKTIGGMHSSPDRITIGSYDDGKSAKIDKITKKSKNPIINKLNENKLHLPSGYALIHSTDKNFLKELKPKIRSDKFITGGPAGIGGQYHQTGRVYFTLVKEEDIDRKYKSDYGNHVYKLVSHVNEIFFDGEHSRYYKKDNNMNKVDIDKLLNKPVYVKTLTPLKVKQLK